jgi:cellulose/xylan binding protein with CBM9 domain
MLQMFKIEAMRVCFICMIMFGLEVENAVAIENLVANGSFEKTEKVSILSDPHWLRLSKIVDLTDGADAEVLLNWNLQARGKARIRVENNNAVEGKRCLHITTGSKFPVSYYQGNSGIGGEDEYICTVKARGKGRFFLRAYEYGEKQKGCIGGKVFLKATVTDKWQEFQAAYIPKNPDTTHWSLVFGVEPDSDVWLDDVCLTKSSDEDRTGDSLKVAFVMPVTIPPTIDGKMDDQCWRKMEKVSSFLNYTDQGIAAKVQTQFAFGYDSTNLYMLVIANEPEMKKVCPTPENVLERPKSESLEVFIDPGCTRSDYFQFIVNMNDNRYDGFRKDGNWKGEWKSKIGVKSRKWFLELAIPLATIKAEKPEVGDRWGINVTRNGRRQSTWSNTGLYFHTPGKFGTLIFGTPPEWWKEKFLNVRRRLSVQCRQRLKSLGLNDGYVDKFDALGADLELRYPEIKSRKDFAEVYEEAAFILNLFQETLYELDWMTALMNVKAKNKHIGEKR